jgi:ribosomal protein S26
VTETLDEIAARHNPSGSRLPECMECGQRWPCDAAVLVAAIRELVKPPYDVTITLHSTPL